MTTFVTFAHFCHYIVDFRAIPVCPVHEHGRHPGRVVQASPGAGQVVQASPGADQKIKTVTEERARRSRQ